MAGVLDPDGALDAKHLFINNPPGPLWSGDLAQNRLRSTNLLLNKHKGEEPQ
jgi:hypothetical protein